MAKSISCKDIGMDCDFKAVGATVEEVMQKCGQHGKEAHGFESIPPEVAAQVMAAIRDE